MSPDQSAAYQIGRIIGMLATAFFMVGGVVFFIVALVKAFTKKTKGWIITTVVMGVLGLLMIVAIVAFAFLNISSATLEELKSHKITQVLTSKDGMHRITVPASWKNMPNLNGEAQIAAGSLIREEYLVVIIERKRAVGVDLAGYAKIVTNNMLGKLKDGTQDAIKEVTVDGRPALRQRLAGTTEGRKIVFLQTYLEMAQHFVQILCWTLAGHETRAFPVYEKVADTFAATGRGTTPDDRARGLIVELFGIERAKLTPASRLKEDLGADELDNVELVMAVEEEFKVSVSDEEAEKWKTVGDVIEWVEAAAKRTP